MERLQDRKQVNNLIVLFTLTYMISYITRINFGAIISEMEEQPKYRAVFCLCHLQVVS